MHTHTHIITQISTNFLHSYSKHCSTQNLLQNTLYRIEHTNLLQVVNFFSPDLHLETVNTRRKKKKRATEGRGEGGCAAFFPRPLKALQLKTATVRTRGYSSETTNSASKGSSQIASPPQRQMGLHSAQVWRGKHVKRAYVYWQQIYKPVVVPRKSGNIHF